MILPLIFLLILFLIFRQYRRKRYFLHNKKSKFKNCTCRYASLLCAVAGKEITLFTLSFPPALLSNGNRRHLFFSYYFFYKRYIFIVYLFPFCHVNYFEAEKVSKLRVFSYLRRIFIFLQQYLILIFNLVILRKYSFNVWKNSLWWGK